MKKNCTAGTGRSGSPDSVAHAGIRNGKDSVFIYGNGRKGVALQRAEKTAGQFAERDDAGKFA